MLSEQEAASILQSNNMNPSTLQLQGKRTLVAKLINSYSFIIKRDESTPGCLCACLNHQKSGDLITWNRIDKDSLLLAIKNVQEFLGLKPRWKIEIDRSMATLTVAFLSLLISIGYTFGSKLAYCSAQLQDTPLSEPEQLSVMSE